jgi:hypothetical protein
VSLASLLGGWQAGAWSLATVESLGVAIFVPAGFAGFCSSSSSSSSASQDGVPARAVQCTSEWHVWGSGSRQEPGVDNLTAQIGYY